MLHSYILTFFLSTRDTVLNNGIMQSVAIHRNDRIQWSTEATLPEGPPCIEKKNIPARRTYISTLLISEPVTADLLLCSTNIAV